MGIQRLVMLQIIILVSIAAAQTLPGCQDQETCGNVRIPYPFGTREGCYYSKRFLVTCNDTYSPPKAILQWTTITDISLDGQISIYYPQAIDCYDARVEEYSGYNTRFNMSGYTVSTTRNKFTVVGCDSSGMINGTRDGKRFATGCQSVCQSTEYIENGTCSGIGCCQISIPKGLVDFLFSVHSFNNYNYVQDFSPCSYAFMVQQDKFNFSLNHLKDLRNVPMLPLVYDWAIGNHPCEVAEKNQTTYACKSTNSMCESRYFGYNCYCSMGYRGNPYIPNGCQDIDECTDGGLSKCTDKCTNIQGSYTCACRIGYHGDGRKDGEGCHLSTVFLVTVASISSCIGVPVLLIGMWWLWKILKRRKKNKLKEKFFERNGGLLLHQQLSSDECNVEKTKIFTSKELEKATDNYNQNRILGQGGQGTVFKGMLTDGRIVAIKHSKKMDEGQLEQFVNEVVILSQINHRNVVKIFGCCLETEIPQLVYEFIPNGTLFQYIHEENEEFPLSWNKRVQIAAEVAGALFYLHSSASIPIYHRDIKSSNILLDEKYRAKVADFGTSKSLAIDQTHLTTRVMGTFGYLDPEYFQSSHNSQKRAMCIALE